MQEPNGKWLAFDIEIANEFELGPGEDLDSYGPFDLTCAAVSDEHEVVKHWYARDAASQPAAIMDAGTACEMLVWLRERQEQGARLFAWNGLSFDLRWLGVAAGELALAKQIALDLYDPMFQFFVQRGFPVSLAAVADGLGVLEAKRMNGADAPSEWARGSRELVLEYVAGDCRITSAVARLVETHKLVRWRTKRGTVSSEPMPVLRKVRELLDAPLPDTSWMDTPLERSKFTAWLDQD